MFRLSATERNLILTGYIQPNQPRLARQVAERLGMRFVDVEQLLTERLGDTVEAVRERLGERGVKALIDQVLNEVALYRGYVVRVNGSTLTESDYRERLQENGLIVVLVARLDAILQRLHLQLGARYHDPAARAAELGILKREWKIRGLPHIYELDMTDLNEAAMLERISTLWGERGLARG